jgi:aquaporin NIP
MLLRRFRVLQVLLTQKALAEMIGTFAVIFVGGGSIILSERHLVPSFCVPIAWGLMVCLMIIAVGHISGAHFNPAVTLAFTVAKGFPITQVPVYWLSQFIGGVTAIALLAVLKKI